MVQSARAHHALQGLHHRHRHLVGRMHNGGAAHAAAALPWRGLREAAGVHHQLPRDPHRGRPQGNQRERASVQVRGVAGQRQHQLHPAVLCRAQPAGGGPAVPAAHVQSAQAHLGRAGPRAPVPRRSARPRKRASRRGAAGPEVVCGGGESRRDPERRPEDDMGRGTDIPDGAATGEYEPAKHGGLPPRRRGGDDDAGLRHTLALAPSLPLPPPPSPCLVGDVMGSRRLFWRCRVNEVV
mmetsp:Transcript_52339/g.104850  ORF Transcript_52339/g.104850 Transcript_52339/m.104850 type:complete len:239 (+) Transcript_52339:520-1236(+)